MLKLTTPSANPKMDALKQIAARAALGVGAGWAVAKFAKMRAAGSAIAIANVAMGVAAAIQTQRGTSGVGAIHQRAADLLESGESRAYVGLSGQVLNDPQAFRAMA